MKTLIVELPSLYHNEPIELLYVSDRQSGYGHKTITVELRYKGVKKDFGSTTSDMPGYDGCTDLDGDEKKIALYNLISSKIEERVQDWIFGLEYSQNQTFAA